MESVDYILRIILKLKDEASKKLAAIRTEVAGIGKDADASKAKIDGISSSINALADRLGNLNKEIDTVKKSIGDLGNKDDIDKINKLGQAIDKVTGSTARFRENGTQEIRVQIAGTDQLIEREEKLLTVKQRAAQLRKEEGLSAKKALERANAEKLAREIVARHTGPATATEADDTSALSKQADVIIREGKRQRGPNKGQKIFQLFDQANDVVIKTRLSLARAEQDLDDLVNKVGEWAKTVTGVADAEKETGKTVKRSTGRRKKANDDVIAATEENQRAVKANTAAIHKTTLAFQDTPDFQEFPDRSASNARERRARATREAIAADQAARLARESDRDTNVPIRPAATDRESRQFNALVDLIKQRKELPKGHGLTSESLSQIREQAKAELAAENALKKRDTPVANRFQQQSSDIGARADQLAALFQKMVKATEAISERFSVEQKGKGFQVIDTETGKRQEGTGLFKTEERAASRREDLIATLNSVNEETAKYINAFKKASENVRQVSNNLIAGVATPSGSTLDASPVDESKPVKQRRAINDVTEAMRVQATRLVELRKAAEESTKELNKLFEVQKKGKKFEVIDTESGKRAAGTGLFGSKRAANERRGELVLDKSTFSPENARLTAALRDSTRKVRRLADAIAKGVEDAQDEVTKVFESAGTTPTRKTTPTAHAAGERKASEEATTVKRKSITLMRKELAQEEELAPVIAKVNKDSLDDRKKLNKTQARAIARIEEFIGPLVNLSVKINELGEKIARVEFQDVNDPRRRFAQTLGGRGKPQDRLNPPTIGGGAPAGQGGKDADKALAEQDKKVEKLRNKFDRAAESLLLFRKQLRDGTLDEEEFFEHADRIGKAMERMVRSAPTDFAEDIGIKLSRTTRTIKAEVEKLKELAKDSELGTVVKALDRIRLSATEIGNEIKLTQGGMQILRVEGEKFKSLGVEKLTAEMATSQRKLYDMQVELDKREASGGATVTLERNIKRIGSRIQAQRESLRQLLDEQVAATSKTKDKLLVDAVALTPHTSDKKTTATSRTVDVVDKDDEVQVESLDQALQRLDRTFRRLRTEFGHGLIDRATAVHDLRDLSAEITALGKGKGAPDVGSLDRRQINLRAREAKAEAQGIIDRQKKLEADDAALQKRVAKAREDANNAITDGDKKRTADALVLIETEAAASTRAVQKALEENDKALKLKAKRTKEANDKEIAEIREHAIRINDARQRLSDAKSGIGVSSSRAGQAQEFEALGREFRTLSQHTRTSKKDANEFGLIAREAATTSKTAFSKLDAEVGNSGNLFTRLTNNVRNFGTSITSSGENIAKLDNQLRGLLVLAIFAFAQQLITVLTGLGGGLVAVGSSALFAGGQLGGAFVAGIAQAIPAVLLLGAALQQVKGVTDAITQANLVQQQGAHAGANAAAKKAKDDTAAANKADAVANAEDGIAQAQDRVKEAINKVGEAQKALTKAREEARKNLQDLIAAEHSAELAARGAVLSEVEAQDALRAALEGGSNVDLKRAQLGVLEAKQGTRDADRAVGGAKADLVKGRDIEGTDSVVSAKSALKDAKKAVDDANDAVAKSAQGLEKANRNAVAVEDASSAAVDKLTFLLSLLSPAQLRLFVALQKIRADYKRVFNDITDIIVDSFVRVVDTADKILTSAPFLASATGLAHAIADAFDAIRTTLFENPEKLGQIFQIINDGAENIRGPITDFLKAFGDAFLNIAVAAGPGLSQLFGWVAGVVQDFDTFTQDTGRLDEFFATGGKHAHAWLDLIKNVVIFFAVLAGAGQQEGLSLVDSFNKSVIQATEWLRDHRAEVTKFFEDAGDVTRRIATFLVDLAKGIISVFNPENLDSFITFLTDSVLPALVIVVVGVGALVDKFLDLINTVPGLNTLVAALLAITIFGIIIISTAGAVAFLSLQLVVLAGYVTKISGGFSKLLGPAGKFVGWLGEMAAKSKLLEPLAAVLGKISGSMVAKAAAGTVGAGVLATAASVGGGKSVGKLKTIFGSVFGSAATKDAIKDAEGVAGKASSAFGSKFFGGASKLLRGFFSKSNLFVALGIGAVTGVISGIKSGNVETGIRDFAHSITLGIVHSAEDIANKAIDKVTEKLSKVFKGDQIDVPRELTDKELFNTKTPAGGFKKPPGHEAEEMGFTSAQDKANAALTKQLDDIEKKWPKTADAIRKLIKLREQFETARKNKDVLGMERIKGQMDGIGEKFPRLGKTIDAFGKKAVKDINKVRTALELLNKPFDIAQVLGEALQRDPKRWKTYVDNSIKEVEKLPPGMQKQGRAAVRRLVDGLESQGALPGKTAEKIRKRVNKPFSTMATRTGQSVRRMNKELIANLQIALNAAVAGGSGMVVALNTYLQALGVGPVKHVKVPSAKQLGSIIGGLVGGAGGLSDVGEGSDTQARGGIVGMASGGLLGNMGERGKDLIPTWLGRGEMVLNAFHQRYLQPAVNAYYGHPLEDTFKRLRGEHAGPGPFTGFASGTAGNRSQEIDNALFGPHPHNITAELKELLVLLKRKFPSLAVSSTTDHSRMTSSGNISDHASGHAFDISGSIRVMNAAASFIKRSGIAARLKQGIHNPSLSINQGQTVPSSFWGADTWAAHKNHLHLAMAGALDNIKNVAASVVGRIKKTKFDFPEGPVQKLGQAVTDRIRKAANRKLRAAAAEMGGGDLDSGNIGDTQKLGSGSQAKKIFDYFRGRGFSDNQAAAWVGNFVQESGLNPGVVQPGGQGHGLAQWGGGRFAALQSFAKARKKRWQDLQTQLDFVWSELHGSESDSYSAIKGEKTIEGAVDAIATKYERAGLIGNRLAPAYEAYRKFSKLSFAAGGIVPGGEGQPVDITAHAGEWVVNKLHQSKIAQKLGITPDALRSMLGFYGGPTQFAGSGSVKADEKAANIPFTTGAEKDRIKAILKGLYSLPSIPVTSWADVVREANRALRAIKNIGDKSAARIKELNKEIAKLEKGGITKKEQVPLAAAKTERTNLKRQGTSNLAVIVDKITSDDGLLAKLDTAREEAVKATARQINKLTFRLLKSGKVVKIDNAVKIADKELEGTQKALADIIGEQGIVNRALRAVNRRLHKLRGGKGGVTADEAGEVQQLVQQQSNLKTKKSSLKDDKAAAIAAVFEAEIARQQVVVDAISKQAEAREAGFGLRERIANLFGDKGALNQIATDRIASMQQQIGELSGQLAGARGIGNTELADSIQATINDLYVSIQEQIQARIQNLVETINKAASDREFTLGIFDRLLAITGNKGALNKVIDGRINSIRDQISGLQNALQQAQSTGNTALATEISQQIIDLVVTVAELAKQKIQNAIDAINETAGRTATSLDLRDRLAAVFGNKGELNKIINSRLSSIKRQIFGLNSQLKAARKAGNQDLVDSLTAQIAELNVSLQELAKQKIQNSIDEINHQAANREFALGIRQRLADLFGNTGAISQIATDRIASVRKQIAGLQNQLKIAGDAGNADLVESLSQSILDLQTTIVETINGQLRAAMDQINTVASRRNSKLDLFGRMADALGQVGLGGSATVGGETLTRGGVFAARGAALTEQRTALQQLLQTTQNTPESAQNTQLIQDLTDQLAELDVTIAENTKAAFNARVEDVNGIANFALNILSLKQQIVELTGQIAQTDTANEVLAMLQQRALVLEKQNTALSALLAEAQDTGDQQAIQDLTTQMLENQVAVLENTIAINQLTHKDDLQQFSSSAWLQFREAIFDGLGNLLPKFSIALPSAAMGAHIASGGMINVHTGEEIIPAKVAGSSTIVKGSGDINLGGVHVTNPTEVADPVYLGNAIGWRIVNNPNLRP